MSRRWETYHLGSTVRIRQVGASATRVEPVAAVVVDDEPAPVDESLTKAELVAEAERRGVDASGTKAEIVERLNG